MGRQQAMRLRSHVANLQLHVVRQLPLNGEVVLGGILRAHMRLEISEKEDRLKCCPILRVPSLGADDSVKRIQISRGAILAKKRLVKLRLVDKGAAAEWRLSAELLQHQLLDRIIEKSPTSSNTGLTGVSRTPGKADAGSNRFVRRVGHARLNSRVSRNNQADCVLRSAIGIRTSTREDGGLLAGAERLDVLGNVRQRGVQFPSQPV